ncbi:MAG: hypothetical protein NTX29_03610, partial [Actinobacteria bacterium]|nr:hypothetical protein [Actinomycetota bacterium]
MNAREAVRQSLQLLDQRDRRNLLLVTGAQMSTAFLDLLGVLLIGVVTALSVAAMSGTQPPDFVMTLFNRFGISGGDTVTLALWLALIAGAV